MKNQDGFVGIVFMTLISAFLIWVVLFVPIFGFNYNTGDGVQVGYISAVENNGVFFKTYTAYVKPTLESTQEDMYCVIDEDIIEKLILASEKKQNVKVGYYSLFSAGMKKCGGEGAIISEVTVIK